MSTGRFDRSERLLGAEGQRAIRNKRVVIIGAGGLGSFVVQELALLGVGKLAVFDEGVAKLENRNRYAGMWSIDVGTPKVDIAKRHAELIDPEIDVVAVQERLPSRASLDEVKAADAVFGCVDGDGPRFILNEVCLAYRKPLFDLASDVPEPGYYGGRVSIVLDNTACLQCRGLFDDNEVRRFLSTEEMLENEAAVYGVDRSALHEVGPSVVSLNGVVASLGVTEFMAWASGLRDPRHHLEYRAHVGTVSHREDSSSEDCYYCQTVRGAGDAQDVERYVRRA